jgi:site-specific recombinase XerD
MNARQQQQKEAELEKLRDRIRAKGYSLETERSYLPAVGKFIDFICARQWPEGTTTERKVEAFLTAEAKRGVSASTQNAKFQAILFYYRMVRGVAIEKVDALRAKTGERKRQAPPREETQRLLMAVADTGAYPTRLICHLIFACGLRLNETLMIRLKDLDLASGRLMIIGGKGKKDRFINLPPSLIPRLEQQVRAAEVVHGKAVLEGVPVQLPHLYTKKNPAAAFQKKWFWLFPQMQPCRDPRGPGRKWWHCLDTTVQRAMVRANRRAGTEGIMPHHLRHAWATYAHADGAHMRDLQEVLGHKNIETTANYVRPDPERVPSPFEGMRLVA